MVMKVPTYQIQKIIRVYIKQLIQSELAVSNNRSEEKSSIDRIKINTQGEHWEIINKVTADLVERITNFGLSEELDREIINRFEKRSRQ
jgi:hypothetical protein